VRPTLGGTGFVFSGTRSPLPFALSIAFACFRRDQGISPLSDGLGYLCLFPYIHMVRIPDHDGVHATGAARLTLGAGLEQFQIRLSSNIFPAYPGPRGSGPPNRKIFSHYAN
jgi:hypothetical protein